MSLSLRLRLTVTVTLRLINRHVIDFAYVTEFMLEDLPPQAHTEMQGDIRRCREISTWRAAPRAAASCVASARSAALRSWPGRG